MHMQQNGAEWLDESGNTIHAHGGHILEKDGWYYWYGENRLARLYVSCYRSRDLVHWEFRNHVLTADSRTEPLGYATDLSLCRPDGKKVNIERPKVLYCEKTGQYVMWAHYENGKDYHCARACIAVCDTPDGDFIYRGSFNPCGQMSRDCTLFLDDDGTAYFLSSANDNADLHVYRLTNDFLGVRSHVNTLFCGAFREAPAVFKKDGKYYLISSFCSGWEPNQGQVAAADSMDGAFGAPVNFGDETTFA